MPALSDYLEAAILNATLRGVAFPAPTAVYIALYSADPADDNSGAELTAANSPGYARVQVPASGWSLPLAGSDATTVSNLGSIDFPTATANWPAPATHFGVLDAATGGNLLYYGRLTTAAVNPSGSAVRFTAGSLQISLD